MEAMGEKNFPIRTFRGGGPGPAEERGAGGVSGRGSAAAGGVRRLRSSLVFGLAGGGRVGEKGKGSGPGMRLGRGFLRVPLFWAWATEKKQR